MKPRFDDLELYRQNIYKSWQIMHEVVRQIDQECYIAHLEPFQGVGYDCLSLVTRNSIGNLVTSFMLNRNGVNGLCGGQLIEDVWRRASSEDEVSAIARLLIDGAELSRRSSGDSKNKMAQISKFVVSWIQDHRDEDFCVSPPGWPEGCVNFSDRNFEASGRGDWEIEDHAPWLVLGIRYKELIRIDMTDDLTTTTKGESVYSEEGKRKEFGTDYLVALKDWGRFDSEPSVLEKVVDVIKNCERELGAVTLAYSVKSEQYVAIRFEKAPGIGSVFVNRGFVDHRVELPGSHWNKTHDIWRTNLPTGSNSAASHKKLPEIKHLTCKMCFQQYPASMSGCPVCTQAD
jgi:hypothetical protein